VSRVQIDPLRPLLEQEREDLEKVSRSRCAPAAQVARAQALLAVAAGQSFTEAALLAGRRTGDTIRDWVSRFNRQGVAAVVPRQGGGPPPFAMATSNSGAFSPKSNARRIVSGTARRRGR
jgi:helix-turn-helix protein